MKEKAVKPNFTHSIKIYIWLRKSYRKKMLFMNFQDQEMREKIRKIKHLKWGEKNDIDSKKLTKPINLLKETELECRI